MATKTIEVPDPIKVMKDFWRKFRAIVWTLLLALAVALVLVSESSPSEFLTFWRWWIIFGAAAVYFYPQMANRFGVKRG
jgi:hypothetical protein